MKKFPHLQFLQKVSGKPRLHGGGTPNPHSEQNKRNKSGHSGYLSSKTSQLKDKWHTEFSNRESNGLAPIDAEIIPVFLKINPDLISYDFDLKQFGIEIISEEEDGYIIGASLDGFASLDEKINKFFNGEHGGVKLRNFGKL